MVRSGKNYYTHKENHMGKTGWMGAVIVVAACIFILSAVVYLQDTAYYQPIRWIGILLFFAGIVMMPTYSAKRKPGKEKSFSLYRVFVFLQFPCANIVCHSFIRSLRNDFLIIGALIFQKCNVSKFGHYVFWIGFVFFA